MFLKADKKMVKLYLHEIGYIESLKDYVRVFTADRVVVSHQTLSYLQVTAYSQSSLEILDQEVPIGRTHKAAVMEWLQTE